MARWVIASLGGSDIQFASDIGKKPEEKRFKDFYNDCRDLYYLLKETGDTGDIIVPILQAMVQELANQGHPPDRMLLLYTDQRRDRSDAEQSDIPGMSKDTLWAYHIIKYLAEETDFFGMRLRVDGIYVHGNPASYEEMVYLYKQVMTADNLKSLGVSDHDELYACFTGGTPAMSHYLMLGYSSLHMPRRRECYTAHMRDQHTVVHRIPVVELIRYDDVFGVLKEMLRSRQFPEAFKLLESTRFSFLEGYEREVLDWIQVLHQRYLFCFDDALQTMQHCRIAFRDEPFFDKMRRELQVLRDGMEKYDQLTADNLNDTDIKVLTVEYLHKVLFFWESKQWNEFAFIACSFYEWLLQMTFYDAIGFSFARNIPDKDKKNWYSYLRKKVDDPIFPVWLKGYIREMTNMERPNSDRHVYWETLKRSPHWSEFAQSVWCRNMNVFYREIRNKTVHRLRGNDEQQVVGILGRDWPKQTIQVLREHFNIEASHSKFEHGIRQFLEFLNRMFDEKYVLRTNLVSAADKSML